jgi:hypothetical protein
MAAIPPEQELRPMSEKNGPARERGAKGRRLVTAAAPLNPESDASKGAIRADLFDDDRATAFGYTVTSPSPVLSLCRDLIDAGCFPHEPLEAWRGAVLCLRIRSIGAAARLEVNSKGTGFVCSRAVRIAPPVGLSGPAYGGSPPCREAVE